MKRIIGITLALICLLGTVPAMDVEAATIEGEHATRATAYNWGAYSNAKTLSGIKLPAGQDELWVRFTVPSNTRIYARCSYSNEYEGMFTEMFNSANQIVGAGFDVINPTTVIPFLAANADNRRASTQTFFLRIVRGNFTGDMIFSLILYDRIYTGSGTFNVTVANNTQAAQQWEFQYNALATAKSTMKNVKLTLKWEYDIADTKYARY